AYQPASSKLTLIRPSGMSRGRLSYTTSWDTIRQLDQVGWLNQL
ncbi:hypothetical protein EV665_1571, partial [Shinella granuli]